MKRAPVLATPAGQLLAFAGAATLCVVLSIAAAGAIVGLLGIARPDVAMALASAVLAALLLILSAYLLRCQGTSLAALAFRATKRRMRELGLGFAVSATLLLGVVWAQSVVVGAAWEFQGVRGIVSGITGLALAASLVLAEELLFRGVGLRALRGLCGDRAAILLSALLFGTYHLIGSGDWAMGAVFRFLTPTLGGLLFGWAAVRSGGLALPIGLHLGGNWVQASVAGFRPVAELSAPQPTSALWQIPVTSSDVQALTAPDLLPHLPYLAAVALAAAITVRYILRQPSRTAVTHGRPRR